MSYNTSDKGTDVIYNGVHLRNVLTRTFDQSVQYDDSGTDRMFNRFNISVESLVSDSDLSEWVATLSDHLGADGAPLNPGGALLTSQQKLQIVHALLSVPRQNFIYRQGDATVVEAVASITSQNQSSQSSFGGDRFSPATDLDNGPKPRSVQVTQVIANRVYRIAFSIEVCLLYCGDFPAEVQLDNGARTPEKRSALTQRRLLSNRFSIDETRDGNFYNTRVLMGRARVAHMDLWSEAIRILVLPSLQPGYKREQVQFVVDPNGLDMSYRVVDKQRYAAPPYPATDFSGVHQETTGIDGAVSQGAISVKVFGSPDALKKALLLVAISIIQCRIGQFGKIAELDDNVVPEQVTITDVLQENVVEVSVQYMRKGGTGKDKEERWLDIMTKRLGLLPSVAILQLDPKLVQQGKTDIGDENYYRVDGRAPNTDIWPVPSSPWDDGAPYGIFAQYLQDGCVPVHSTPDTFYTDEVNPEDSERPPARTATVSTTPIGEDVDKYPGGDVEGGVQVSQEQQSFPYTHVEIRSDYANDYGYVSLPKFSDAVAPADGDVVITKLHAGTCKKTVFFSAKRQGGQPNIPEIQPVQVDKNGIVYVLDEMHPEYVAPRLMPDQQNFEYEINMRLNYHMSRALKTSDKLSLGSLPWDTTTREDNETTLDQDRQRPMNPITPKESESDSNKK